MIRTIVQLTETQAKSLKERAKEQGVSISELVRRGVDKVLATPSADDEIRRRALSAIGFISDPSAPDLAENHDTYLAEAYGE